MTTMDKQNEQLSALVDGETSCFETRRLMAALLGNDELRKRWGRYHLIGEAMRQEQPLLADIEFSQRVMTRIDQESIEQPQEVEWQGRRLTRPVLGLAMAAAVAGVMVVGLQSMLGPGEFGGGLQQTPMEAQVVSSVDPGRHVPTQLESYMRMNSYLFSHVEQSGAQGMLPYARMIAHAQGNP